MIRRVLLVIMVTALPLSADTVGMLTDTMGTSAYQIGIGQISGMTSASSEIFGNPAAIGTHRHMLSYMTTELPDPDSHLLNVSASLPIWGGAVGLGLMSIETNNLGTTASTEFNQYYTVSTFSVHQSLVALGYQTAISPATQSGATVKYFQQSFGTAIAQGVNADIGMTTEFSQWQLSIAAHNILYGSQVQYSDNGGSMAFPFQFKSGIGYTQDNWRLLGQVHFHGTGGTWLKSAGAEWSPWAKNLTLLGGYTELNASGVIVTCTSVGVKLGIAPIALSVSYILSDMFERNSQYFASLDIQI